MDSWQRAVLLSVASLGLLALAQLYGRRLWWEVALSPEQLAEIAMLEAIPTLERDEA